MENLNFLTDISRIGMLKEQGEEWVTYTKKIFLERKPTNATIKLTSEGVCAIYVNGQFIETHMGRLPNRVAYFEITSELCEGENEVVLLLGSHIYQSTAKKVYKRRGSWFLCVAAEIVIKNENDMIRIVTDENWKWQSECGEGHAEILSQITQGEYARFWEHAALWPEVSEEIVVPKEVIQVAGADFETYIKQPKKQYSFPKIIQKQDENVLYDFGRVEVGYVILEYEASQDTQITLLFDYSEKPLEEFQEENKYWCNIQRMALEISLKKGCHVIKILRRRACRYLLIQQNAKELEIKTCKLQISMKPAIRTGWFKCDDTILNRIWEVGKHTLQVNKHQGYESCPRHEMKFFSGDGIITALADYYAFGDGDLVDSSLSYTELAGSVGVRTDMLSRNDVLWDYPALRIIMAYNHYIYTKDEKFVLHYYKDLTDALMWMINKLGKDYLIYQYPLWDMFFANSDAVEYTGSYDRLGQKTYLNALVYKSLVCMSEFAKIQKDPRADEWNDLAKKMKNAINETLWSEENRAYIDLQYPNNYAQDGNALAVLFGIADVRQSNLVFESLQKHNWSPYGAAILSDKFSHTRGGNCTVSPLICTYEAEARFLCGDHRNALQLIRNCWGTMIRKGAETFWEFAPNDGTSKWNIPSHGWSSGATYLLSAYGLGIRPNKPGYEEILFSPSPEISNFEGVVYTKQGYVAANCLTDRQGAKTYTIALPETAKLVYHIAEDAKINIIRY